MTIQERGVAYNASEFGLKFPDSQFMVSPRWISATWIMGNNYKSLSARGEDDQPFYGSFPPGFLRRIWPMFTDCGRIIHLFSGSLTSEQAQPPWSAFVQRIDMNPDRKPDLLLNAENFADEMPAHMKGAFDLVIADPPYSEEDSRRYGVCLCNKKKVLEQCHLVLKPGGILMWMDQAIPMYAKTNWKWVGVISMYRSTNHRIRGVMIFERQ